MSITIQIKHDMYMHRILWQCICGNTFIMPDSGDVVMKCYGTRGRMCVLTWEWNSLDGVLTGRSVFEQGYATIEVKDLWYGY